MKIKIRNRKDFYAGLGFIFFGGLAVFIARNYPMGTAARVGPGYFPFILGSILSLLGLIIAVRSLWLSIEAIGPFVMRPLVLVLGSVVAFAILVQPIGLVLALLVLVVISSLGGSEFRPREVAILYLALAVMAIGIFVYSLGLPFKVWPS